MAVTQITEYNITGNHYHVHYILKCQVKYYKTGNVNQGLADNVPWLSELDCTDYVLMETVMYTHQWAQHQCTASLLKVEL